MDPVLIRNQRLPVSQVRGILDDVLGIGRVAEEETKSLLSYATIELRCGAKFCYAISDRNHLRRHFADKKSLGPVGAAIFNCASTRESAIA